MDETPSSALRAAADFQQRTNPTLGFYQVTSRVIAPLAATPVASPIARCKRLSRLASVPRGETEARASFCQSPGPLELNKSRRAETRPQGYCPIHRLR